MTKLPLLLSLEYAAQRTGLDIETLREMIEQGKVMAGISSEGALMVAVRDGKVVMLENGQATGNGEAHEPEGDVFELNRRLAAIKREQFKHLEGVPISVQEVERKYGIPKPTLHYWARRGYVKVLHKGNSAKNPSLFDEGDVAYCAAIYRVRKAFRSRGPLLDNSGKPYLIHDPRSLRRQSLVISSE